MGTLFRLLPKEHLAASALTLVAIYVASIAPSADIAWVCALLLLTVFLFAFEIMAVDVTAMSVMVLLGLSTLGAPWMGLEQGLIPIEQLFDGFSSHAVISIIAVMIIGAGLDKTGVMSQVARLIMRLGGRTEPRIIPLVSGSVGIMSSFMQNVGAAALFLPVISRISAHTGLPPSRLLMPMGFCAILGGTITMVGSSPLILLNDLLLAGNAALPEGTAPMQTFELFAVSPIGLALLTVGILYFVIAARLVLPTRHTEPVERGETRRYLAETYGLNEFCLHEVVISPDSALVGTRIEALERHWKVRVVGVEISDGAPHFGAAGFDRTLIIKSGTTLAVLGEPGALERFRQDTAIELKPELEVFAEIMTPTNAGIAELVVPPGSALIGKNGHDLWLRKTHGLSVLAIHRNGEQINDSTGSVRDTTLAAGDALVAHTTWRDLARLEGNRDFVIVTSDYPHEELRPHKVSVALGVFALTLGLVLFSDLRLSVALMSGAVAMIVLRVLTIEEAYGAVSWKTVFLLASLIPLGVAVENSGAAAWSADQTLHAFGEMPVWGIQAALATLATLFSLVMSNVGATVLLVPLAINLALGVGADPAVFALTVAIATSNSFIIPTHQVNALIMGPGGYRVADFLRAGGIMSVLFLVVSLVMLNLVF